MKVVNYFNVIAFGILTLFFSCSKQDEWLNAKRDNGDITPQTLEDYQAILDNNTSMNDRFINTGLISSDNLFITDQNLNGLISVEREAYLWGAGVWDGTSGVSNDWNYQFNIIAYANIVLEGIEKIEDNSSNVAKVKGQAFFYRAFAYFNLAQLFCLPYEQNTAQANLGLPLRTSSNVLELKPRENLEKTYEFIINDLVEAIKVLDKTPPYTRRPSYYAANGLLAKVYLVMGNYDAALKCAQLAIPQGSSLLDFNSSKLSLSTTYRFPVDTENPEILYFGQSTSNTTLTAASSNRSFVDSTLMGSYIDTDLRKTYFFAPSNGYFKFRGSYTGNRGTFCGIALNEIYLIKAECLARNNRPSEAIAILNQLLLKRYKTGTFEPLPIGHAEQVLTVILSERRKELPFTGMVRWEDLKRLSTEASRSISPVRYYNGKMYRLNPGDAAYAFPIPQQEISLSGIQQNPR